MKATTFFGVIFAWLCGFVACLIPLATNIGVYLWGRPLLEAEQRLAPAVGIVGTIWTAVLLTAYLLLTSIGIMVAIFPDSGSSGTGKK